MFTQTITETAFLLPEDGDAAKAAFLDMLRSPGETWICAYGFTLQQMFAEILAADAAGVPIHILLDHSQATGHAEAPKVKALVAALQHGDVTITTAGPGSRAPSQIWHWKGLAVMDKDPSKPTMCWRGSVNFSDSGWLQGNDASLFASNVWGAAFIAQFNLHAEWARSNEPQYQLARAA